MRAWLLRGNALVRYYGLLPALIAAVTGMVVQYAAAQRPYECASWSAWIDRAPGGRAMPTLHLRGKCAFHVAGNYDLEFKPHRPSSADPNVMLLDFGVRVPRGTSGVSRTSATISYDRSVSARYKTVLLLPDRVAIPVRQVY